MRCQLCLRQRDLQKSHMIPGFVYRWLRESSPTGYLRTTQAPNKRVQDGPTCRLLCAECEGLFSGWEKSFSEQVFLPLHKGTTSLFQYSDWALKFAVSVSWRTLVWPQDGRWSHLHPWQLESAGKAAEMWRQFLIGEREHPGSNEQRMIPLDVLESHTTPEISPFINRYMLRTVVADVVRSKRLVFTYTKLCRILILGFVDVPNRAKWRGGKVSVKRGSLGGPAEYHWPREFSEYVNHSANTGGAALGRMSAKQTAKLAALMEKDPERIANTEVFRAMTRDVEFSGTRAFRLKDLNADRDS